MNKEEISININYNDNIFHQLLSNFKGNNYHWFKCKLEDGSEIDLVEKKDYDLLQQENKQLKDNWNKMKEYCESHYYGITTIGVLDKMKELEKGDSDVE